MQERNQTQEQVAKIVSNAKKVASRYLRTNPRASREDMEQEAVLAQLSSAHLWDEESGVPFGAYMWRVSVLATRTWLWKSNSPVSTLGRPTNLRGAQSLSLLVYAADGSIHDRPLPSSISTPEHLVARMERATIVRKRLKSLLGAVGANLAIGVLSEEYRAREASVATGIPVDLVYRMMREIRCRIESSRELNALWHE
jgi:hypothetical protein